MYVNGVLDGFSNWVSNKVVDECLFRFYTLSTPPSSPWSSHWPTRSLAASLFTCGHISSLNHQLLTPWQKKPTMTMEIPDVFSRSFHHLEATLVYTISDKVQRQKGLWETISFLRLFFHIRWYSEKWAHVCWKTYAYIIQKLSFSRMYIHIHVQRGGGEITSVLVYAKHLQGQEKYWKLYRPCLAEY